LHNPFKTTQKKERKKERKQKQPRRTNFNAF